MASSSKGSAQPPNRRKSGKPALIVTLKVKPNKLRAIIDPTPIKGESPVKESPENSNTLPAAPPSVGENASDSTPNTPGPTPCQSAMGPPTEGIKKKAVKRSAPAANESASADAQAKVRGKPGPKKRLKVDDVGGEIAGVGRSTAGHKLGPKANQGAINAGLRALDRSGKPCRKWSKGGFTLKSFTGVVWEIPRWTAPPKLHPRQDAQADESASADGSSKENKENGQMKGEVSNNGADVDLQSAPSVNASSPAPVALSAAATLATAVASALELSLGFVPTALLEEGCNL